MKRELTKSVVQALKFSQSGHYIVADAHPDAPTGFGIRVSKSVKTYILKIRQGARMLTATVGRHPDLLIGKGVPPNRNARYLAGAISARIRAGEDVNAAKRERLVAAKAAVKTLRDLFEDWLRNYNASRKNDPRPNTILAVKKAMDRLGDELLNKPAEKVSYKDLEAFFEAKAATHLTAAEQTIRWVSTVYNRANERLQLDALEADIEAIQYRNPAAIFAMKGHLRDRNELERDYEKKGVRRPLSGNAKSFRKWMDYVIEARGRGASRTAADYMLVTVVMGYRRMETKSLRWRDRISEAEARNGNYVDPNERRVVLHVTKNRYLHVLPIPDFCFQLLQERKKLVGKRTPWVFPATSRSPLRKVAHYSDSRGFMAGLKSATGVLFSEHDLRRTFGNIVNQMKMPTTLAKQLLNHKHGDGATGLYTAQSLEQLREVLNDIETEMLSYATANPKGTSKVL